MNPSLALRRYIDHSLHDDGIAIHLGLVCVFFARVGQPHPDLGLVAAVPDKVLDVGRPLGRRGVATQGEHCSLGTNSIEKL